MPAFIFLVGEVLAEQTELGICVKPSRAATAPVTRLLAFLTDIV